VSEDVKPDPVLDKLGRFTPDATGINRDEWLFAAGRASARTPRGWKAAAGVLALTQAAILVAWLSAPRVPAPTVPVISPAAVSLPAEGPDAAFPYHPNSYEALSRTFDPDAPPPLPPDSSTARQTVSLRAGWRGAIE
jgi:hypothetical protein